VKRAALTGFRPSGLAGVKGVAQRLGLRDFDPGREWVAQVMDDSTDWAVCDTCAGQFDQHLSRTGLSVPASMHPLGKWRRRIGRTIGVIALICALVYFFLVFRGTDWWAAGLLFAAIGLGYLANKLTGE
jgi:hypothetical protein